MKPSARNALPGLVVALVRGATTAHVKADNGDEIGKPATAVVKASDLMVGVD